MKFFTADTHFFHTNIIKYCNRPFKNVEEMNETMVENWNKKVDPEDNIYIIGDFIMGNRPFEAISLIERLNGKKILIWGSHDKVVGDIKDYFSGIHTRYVLHKGENHPQIIMDHYKLLVWPKSHYGTWNLYGHSHGGLSHSDFSKIPDWILGKSMDVGVDCNNFTPVSLDEVIAYMETRPDNFNYIKREHGDR